MAVEWLPAAFADLARIVDYIAAENPRAASAVAEEFYIAAAGLNTFPRRGRRGLSSGTRELVVIRTYILVYEVGKDDNVTILRLWHGAQDR
jgi:addiction module RelE/StbE family toxin